MSLKELCQKYHATDSISERGHLHSKIQEICNTVLNNKYELNHDFPEQYSDFRGDGMEITGIFENEIEFSYERFWSYGGHCEENHTFKIGDLAEHPLIQPKAARKKRELDETNRDIAELKYNISSSQKQIESLTKKKIELS